MPDPQATTDRAAGRGQPDYLAPAIEKMAAYISHRVEEAVMSHIKYVTHDPVKLREQQIKAICEVECIDTDAGRVDTLGPEEAEALLDGLDRAGWSLLKIEFHDV